MKGIKHFLLGCTMLFPFIASATHMMGAEITYKWLGNKKFELTAKIYRDCRGIPLKSPIFNVFDQVTTTMSMSYTRVSIEDITVRCADSVKGPCRPDTTSRDGVELHIYKDTIDFGVYPYNAFPNAGSCKIYFSMEQCCRNGAITTINPGNFYVEAMLDICNSNYQNSSPQFKSKNVTNASCNMAFTQNFGSKDYVDYDSLGYELTTPLNGVNSPESYYGSFTPSIPMTPFCLPPGIINCKPLPNSKPPRGFYFNKMTGDIVFTPGNCSEVGVIVMKVSEYRRDSTNTKWLLVGYVIRDLQIVVVKSYDNELPTVALQPIYNFKTRQNSCIDLVTFDTANPSAPGYNKFNKGDKSYLSIVELPPGATLKYVDSSAKNKTGRLCWKIHDSVYIKFKNKDKLLPITVDVWDNYCYTPGKIQKSFNIRILPPDSSGFISINTFKDDNKNNIKDVSDKGIPVLLKFRDKFSAYYVDTDAKGELADSIGNGLVKIGVAPHPYYHGVAKDTNLLVIMDSAYHLDFGIVESAGIYGRIYEDANGNCQYDKGELPYSGYKVYTDSNKYMGISDSKGIYYINAPKGTYNVSCDYKPAALKVNCPPSKIITVTINGDSAYKNNDFGISKNMQYMDVSTGLSISRLRRGNAASVTFYCTNNGPTTRKNIKLYSPVNSNFDLTLNSSLFAKANSTAAIQIDSILPYKTFSLKLDFMVYSGSFAIGDKICFTAKTDSTTTAQDSVLINNSIQECRVVDAPYDPNEKRISIDSFKTTLDQTVAYTIHFQNSGTDTATRIVVKDTIDTRYLDMTKFQLNWSDYPCEPMISGNVIYFVFNNINLPFFSKSGDKSMAGFNYTLGLKQNIVKETSFANRAAIYFDFETPVFTKNAIGTINSPIVIKKVLKPNGCKNESNKLYYRSNIQLQTGNQLIVELSDGNGSFASPVVLKTINTVSKEDSIPFNLPKSLNAGNYKLRIKSTNPASMSIPVSGYGSINAVSPPAYLLNTNLNNNKACEKDTLKISFTNNTYLYKVIRNNVALSGFNTVRSYNFAIKLVDSFKIIALDNATNCKDTTVIYPVIYKKPIISAAITNKAKVYCSGKEIELTATGGIYYIYKRSSGILGNKTNASSFKTLLDMSPVYQVTGEDANGCSNESDTIGVNVNPTPVATISSNPNPICKGDSISLVYGTALNYDLYKNNVLLLTKTTATSYKISNLLDGDKYKITAFSDKGCFSSSNELTIVINPVPLKPVITRNNNDLSVNFSGNIQWYRNGQLLSNSGNTIVNAPGGSYKVIVTNLEGCTNTSDVVIHQNTGIDKIANQQFRIYPNPASQQLTVEYAEGVMLFDVQLFDMSGRLVYSSTYHSSLVNIDISSFANGLYHLKIQENNGDSWMKIISIVR